MQKSFIWNIDVYRCHIVSVFIEEGTIDKDKQKEIYRSRVEKEWDKDIWYIVLKTGDCRK